MRRFAAMAFVVLATTPVLADVPPTVRLAEDGKALLSVVVADDASDRVKKSAQTLADYLGRISGARFDVTSGKDGIALAVASDKPLLAREEYELRSHAGGLRIVGNSESAIEHAVWDLLYRLGHRQFFPGPTWEVIPKTPRLSIAVDVKERPSYHMRRIWYGYGPSEDAAAPYAEWCARNRATGLSLSSGHAYDGIIHRHEADFKAHPEMLGLVGGERKSSKFCIGNADLRSLVIDDAIAHFRAKLDAVSVSVEPSDGGGWCQCEKCKALGSVSDRAIRLANDVAAAVNDKVGDRLVGLYAYNEHSPPPTIKVHPKVVVSVATAFIKGGYTVDQLLDGWNKQGATLGVREYYSVNTWDRDLPGAARGSNIEYLKTTIPHFHEKGARFLSAESSDNWGCNGLGYYLAARMLWDVREAERIDALKEDFLDRCFGPAKEPMAAFYKLIDGSKKPLLSDDLVGRMYRLVADARKRTDDPAVLARLADLAVYTRHVDLWLAYSTAQGEPRQKEFEEMIRHAWRARKTMMVHTKALYRDVPARDKSVTVPPNATWNVPEGKNPWKTTTPFTRDDIDGLISTGIADHKLLDFEPVSFGDDLVPAEKLNLPKVTPGNLGIYSRGVRTYLTLAAGPGTTWSLKAKGGLVYGDRGEAKLTLYPAADVEGKAVDEKAVTPDKMDHEITLKTNAAGLHRIEVSDRGAGTAVEFAADTPLTVASSPESPAALHGRWSLYFYVPKGTKVVGGYASNVGTLLDGGGRKVFTFESKPGYFSVPVPAGEDGKLWKFQQCAGQRLLMTVPPYLARSGSELLLPAEVVKRDAK